MQATIFYSWQSDLPNSTNRGFIESALESAIKNIKAEDSIKIDPVMDRDTLGIPGSPDIGQTILAKIGDAGVFVCDVSLINKETKQAVSDQNTISEDESSKKKGTKRLVPNPNVLVELGYALKALGSERIIMVMNTAFGTPEELPFDLRVKRVVQYHYEEKGEDKTGERKKLEGELRKKITAALTFLENQINEVVTVNNNLAENTCKAIYDNDNRQTQLLNSFIKEVIQTVDSLNPNFKELHDQEPDELLIEAIKKTYPLACDFGKVCASIAETEKYSLAEKVYDFFEYILRNYNLPRGVGGVYDEYWFDFYRFVGHELFVIFFAGLIREKRWDMISDLLDQRYHVDNWSGSNNIVSYKELSGLVYSLYHGSNSVALGHPWSHAKILFERYKAGKLSEIVSFQQFTDADLFLSLRAKRQINKKSFENEWIPWSALYTKMLPHFLTEAYNKNFAIQLLKPLALANIDEMKSRIASQRLELREIFRKARFFEPLLGYDPDMIGSYR